MTTPDQFRADYPEFSDASRYSDTSVQTWLTIAGKMLDAGRWGEVLDLGEKLFTAHHLVLADAANKAAAFGKTPGEVLGPVAAKAVGQASVSYQPGVILENAGHWNLSTYGLQFRSILRMMGAGPIQI